VTEGTVAVRRGLAAGKRSVVGTVAVTGAAGFLGREVSKELIAHGFQVIGVVRVSNHDVPEGVQPFAIEDLHDGGRLERGLRGAHTVVHLAGRAHVFGRGADDLAAFRQVNVEGTRAVLQAAIDAGVETFVYVSSLAAATAASPYGHSKREAEDLLRSLAVEAGLHVRILRPAMTFGPGMKGNPLWLFRAIDRGQWLPVASILNARSILFSGNLAAAVVTTLTAERGGSEPIAVADDPAVSTPELVREIARALCRPARLFPVSAGLLRGLGRAGDHLPRVMRFPLRSSVVDRLTESLVVDTTPLKALGHVQRYTMRDAFDITARWYRSSTSRPGTAG
jgi:UDP-glucose 4-epimerase